MSIGKLLGIFLECARSKDVSRYIVDDFPAAIELKDVSAAHTFQLLIGEHAGIGFARTLYYAYGRPFGRVLLSVAIRSG